MFGEVTERAGKSIYLELDDVMEVTKKPTNWKVLYYSIIAKRILKKISTDTYCFPPGNNSLTIDVRSLQRTIDEIQLAAVEYNSNIQPLYNIFATNYAAKAIRIITKADLLFPRLLELFGKAQFLGKEYLGATWDSVHLQGRENYDYISLRIGR